MKLALKTVSIGEVVERSKTWNPSRSSADEVFQYIDLSAVDQDAKLITGAREVSCGEAPSRARQIVENGDILVSTVRPNLNGVASVPGELDGATASTGFCVLRASKTKASSAYLFHWVKSPMFIADMVSKATGASYPAVSDRIIFESQIPLPPLAEQKRIAAILDAADALRTKRRETLAQLDALLQSTFLTLFGDPVTNPMGWPVVPLHRIGKFVSGATPSKERAEFWGGRIPWVSPKDMKRDFIGSSIDTITSIALQETNIKLIEPGHLLIVVRGMILAHSFPAALNTHPVTINQDMKAIKPSESFLPLYLLRCMKAQKRGILAMISEAGHGTKKFDQKSMEATNVPVPPLPLQKKFATIVESIERQKAAQRAHLAELDALFAALQHRAFRGEL